MYIPTDEYLAKIRERYEAATLGPWWTRFDYGCENACVYFNSNKAGYINGSDESTLIYDEGGHSQADADFIAHAREDLPNLELACRNLKAALADKDAALREAEMALRYIMRRIETQKPSPHGYFEIIDKIVKALAAVRKALGETKYNEEERDG